MSPSADWWISTIMLDLVCATSNPHKLREFQLAAASGVSIRGCTAADCPETGESFEENAVQKAHCYFTTSPSEWLFADDSGLEVDALHGAPGILSARFAGPGASDSENNALLLRKLAGVPRARRTARFVCAIALLHDGVLEHTFRREVEGLILYRRSGWNGFGYDPLFHYPPLQCSFGQLAPEAKWELSHRGQAFRAMLDWLAGQE